MATTHLRTTKLTAGLALAMLALGAGTAGAVNDKVRTACSNDYFKFCPSHAVGSASLRQCMRQAGRRLSPRCIDALADSGEIRRPSR